MVEQYKTPRAPEMQYVPKWPYVTLVGFIGSTALAVAFAGSNAANENKLCSLYNTHAAGRLESVERMIAVRQEAIKTNDTGVLAITYTGLRIDNEDMRDILKRQEGICHLDKDLERQLNDAIIRTDIILAPPRFGPRNPMPGDY